MNNSSSARVSQSIISHSVTRKIGEGAFGMVFECLSIAKPSIKRALKAEIIGIDSSHESLKMEIYVMRKMMSVNAAHSVQLFGAGTERNFNYVVMTLLGLSLSDIRKRLPDEKFSLDTLIIVGIQATDSLKELHSAGFVHRDIKPSNFTVGKEQTDWIYLIDFGICREIMYTEDLQTKLKCPRRNCQFRGTTRYCSVNAHKRKELGRHDDLISMMYMLLEGHAGSLPWKQKDRLLTEKLKSEKEDEMLAAAPKPFARIYEYLRELTYFHSPDYKRIRSELINMAAERSLKPPYQLDWDALVSPPSTNPAPSPTPQTMNREQLLNPPDISTLYDVPDEFPHEESCSDSDRTIPSEQEKRAPPSIYRTEEKTQSDEGTSMMQPAKGKKCATPMDKSTITSPYTLPKLTEAAKTDKKKEEEKKEEKKEKKEEQKKNKDDSTKRKKKEKEESAKGKAKPAAAADPARTPMLATAPTPAATTPATAAANAAVITPKKAPVAKEQHVEAFTPLKKTECSMRRKERSEMRKKRREARGVIVSMKPQKPRPAIKSVKKSQVDSGKKRVETPSKQKRGTKSIEDSGNKLAGGRKPNLSAETCIADVEEAQNPEDKEKKKKRGTTASKEDVSDMRYVRKEKEKMIKDEVTQRMSCMQNIPLEASAHPTRESVSTMQQPTQPSCLAKSRPRTDHTLSSRREGKVKTKGTRRTVHGTAKEEVSVDMSKEAVPKRNNPKSISKGARSRNSRAGRGSNEERTIESSEMKEKKGVLDRLGKLARNPGSISKAHRTKKPSAPHSLEAAPQRDKKSSRSSKKTDEPEKDVPTIPKTPGARSISKAKRQKAKE